MKTTSIIRCSIISSLILFSCSTPQNKDLTAVISVDKMNELYVGLENPVTIAVPEVASEKIQIEVKGGTYQKLTNTQYLVIPDEGNQLAIRSFSIENGDTTDYGTSLFRIKQVPNPNLNLSGHIISDGKKLELPMNAVIANPQFIFQFDNFVFEMEPLKIQSYLILAFTEEGETIEHTQVSGDTIPLDLIEKINALKDKSATIIITNVSLENGNRAKGISFNLNIID